MNIQYRYKKKEKLGQFYRTWEIYSIEPISCYDHDFNSFADWTVVPYWIYDILQNNWYMVLWTSKDTCEFAIDCLKKWWYDVWIKRYKNAPYLLFLCDCWWSNQSRSYLFKFYLEILANEIWKEIRISHYPPYSSKRNPIEHKMFCHVSRACLWIPFTNIEIVKTLISKTSTKKWLTVEVTILDLQYETWKSYPKNYNKTMKIQRDNYLPKRNYKAIPYVSKS